MNFNEHGHPDICLCPTCAPWEYESYGDYEEVPVPAKPAPKDTRPISAAHDNPLLERDPRKCIRDGGLLDERCPFYKLCECHPF